MPADTPTRDGFSLRRWSRRKLDAARASEPADPVALVAPPRPTSERIPVAASPSAPAMPAPQVPPTLPPVESLTIESDFTAFLQPQVDESLKRRALKKLFAEPRFNVMDGLDTYIDDYTKSAPIPPDVLERLMQTFTFNPPVTDEPPGDATAGSSPDAPAALVPSEKRDAIATLEPSREIGTEATPGAERVTLSSDTVMRPGETDDRPGPPSAPPTPDPPATR